MEEIRAKFPMSDYKPDEIKLLLQKDHFSKLTRKSQDDMVSFKII